MNDQPDAPRSHPLFGELLVIPPQHEAEATVARMRHWNGSLKPWDLYQCWLAQEVARLTIHLERLHQKEIAARHVQATQAARSWDEDRRGLARTVAAGLSRHPALVLAQLRRTKHGCELVAARWDTLLAALEKRGSWTNPERRLALNLLDVPPELREAPSDLDAPDGVDALTHMKNVAGSEAQRHRRMADNLAPIDDAEREAAILGLGADRPELVAIRREAQAASRALAWTRAQFKSARPEPRPIDRGDLPAYTPPRPKPKTEPDFPAETSHFDRDSPDSPPYAPRADGTYPQIRPQPTPEPRKRRRG